MSNWACPCNGCKKAQKVIIDQIIEEYRSCANMVESEDRLYCYTWWRHDDCVRIMNLLNKITKNDKYSIPPVRQEVSEAIDKMLTDPGTWDIIKRLDDQKGFCINEKDFDEEFNLMQYIIHSILSNDKTDFVEFKE